jgi:hypothetical protein
MNDLYDWFSRQHHGLRTFQTFRAKLADLSEREPDKTALYALLSRLADRFVEAFNEGQVPIAIADRAYDRLLRLSLVWTEVHLPTNGWLNATVLLRWTF